MNKELMLCQSLLWLSVQHGQNMIPLWPHTICCFVKMKARKRDYASSGDPHWLFCRCLPLPIHTPAQLAGRGSNKSCLDFTYQKWVYRQINVLVMKEVISFSSCIYFYRLSVIFLPIENSVWNRRMITNVQLIELIK